MILKKIGLNKTITLITIMLSFGLFAQNEEPLSLCDSLYLDRMHLQDSLIEIYGLSKETDSLNKFAFDRFYKNLDTTLNCTYPFIQFEKNNFQFHTPNSPTFEHLYFKLQQMVKYKEGKLNVYHFGGSHIQADIYSNIFREHLQSYWEDIPGERGWVFPFKMAKTNNPWNYAFSSSNTWQGYRSVIHRPDSVHYGVTGVAIACADSIIDLAFNYSKSSLQPPINQVRIYHNKGELNYTIEFDSIKNPVISQRTNPILGYTDAYFSKAVVEFQVNFVRKLDTIRIDSLDVASTKDFLPVDSVVYRTVKGEPLYIYGLYLGNREPGISYNSIGVNGAGLYTYRDNENFQEQIAMHRPDLAIFSVGTNDANVPYDKFKPEEFKENLEGIMKKLLATNPNCAILLTVPNDAFYNKRYLNRNVAREREVMVELAKKYEIPIWDLYGLMGGLGSSKTWKNNKLMKADLVHFTSDGYKLKGEILFDAWLKWLNQMELRGNYSLIK
ncbi:MAG TPA: GDSL-type esterase/lipase family protein [Brumimicrobium sp.]|nr:GDSL-type esterase/lipase family protein [Brumimicrobium sp.]